MNLEKMYKMQEALDIHILENARKRNVVMDENKLLEKIILALLTEVGELANVTRCFKHWSLKGPESKERLLEELADVWHFYLSIGNKIGRVLPKNFIFNDKVYDFIIGNDTSLEIIFIKLLNDASMIGVIENEAVKEVFYDATGMSINILGRFLGFTDEEIEQAYIKKHEENYKRQREGY